MLAVLKTCLLLFTALFLLPIGTDYPYDGLWLRRTSSGTRLRVSLGGYIGLTVGWVEGIELPELGRLGASRTPPGAAAMQP